MGMKILVVNDCPRQLAEISSILSTLGHNVSAHSAIEDAWQELAVTKFQAVIANWNMERGCGLMLSRRIRQAEFQSYIYIILLTNLSDQPSLVAGIDAGADDFLTEAPGRYQLAVRLRTAQRFLNMQRRLLRKHSDLQIVHNTIQKDLQNAANTQLAMLPKPLFDGGLKAWWSYRPAIFVGGDTFNYFSPIENVWFFYSIDVSGHGLSAAMLSIQLQTQINAMSQSLYGGEVTQERLPKIPEAFARNLNKLVAENDSDHYLTMIFGIIELKNSVIHYVQAGHPHPWSYCYKDSSLQPVSTNGYPIGLFEGADWSTKQLAFAPGDRLIISSDGLIENAELDTDSVSGGVSMPSMEQKKTMFGYLCSSANDEDLDVKVGRCVGDKPNSKMTDDINVLIFEHRRAA